MVTSRRLRDRLRERVRAERERDDRKWTQLQLSEMLTEAGIPTHWTTIAKIEKGTRAVHLDEAVVLADLFGISTDALLGRRARPAADLLYTVEALLEANRMAAWQVPVLARTIRERASEVADASSKGGWDELVNDALTACDALDVAAAALERVGVRPRSPVARAQRQIIRRHLAQFDKEDSNDDT
jgi:hypothetical protein